MVAGHFMVLAAFLVQPYPEPTFLDEDILDLHGEHGANAAEGIVGFHQTTGIRFV
jgi:hypothetical protein